MNTTMNKSLAKLYDSIELTSEQLPALEDSQFPFKAPAEFIAQIEIGNSNDPLLKQIIPLKAELEVVEGFSQDPVADLASNPLPSLIHKYHGRALLIASPKCDIHCRYCFRRHFPYEQQSNQRHWQQALEAVKTDPSLHEVILSGGDPMSLSEAVLMRLIKAIEGIKHIKTLRIHSRTPIVAPSLAAQNEFINWAKQSRLKVVIVVHCNHANELSEKTASLFTRYKQANITLLNQSVLLKDINDDAFVLEQLSHKLFDQGVLPYYLHQLDKVQGASHFEVKDKTAKQLITKIRSRLPGYLVPKLVREISGQANKTPI